MIGFTKGPRYLRFPSTSSTRISIPIRHLTITTLLFITGWLAGCQSTPQVSLWAHDPRTPLQDSVRSLSIAQDRLLLVDQVALSAAINEVVTFSFQIESHEKPVEKTQLQVAPLIGENGRIEPSNVQLYRIAAVPTTQHPGWHLRSIPPHLRRMESLDILIPLHAPRGALPNTLLPGESYSFWVDISVPKGTAPGRYAGRIELWSRKRVIQTLVYSLEVLPIILPDEGDVHFLATLDHGSLFSHHLSQLQSQGTLAVHDWSLSPLGPRMNRLLLTTMQLLQDHGLTPVLNELTPHVKIDIHGALQIDWSAYDAIVEPYLNGQAFFNRVPLHLWPLPIQMDLVDRSLTADRKNPDLGHTGGTQSYAMDYLKQCADHFDRKGWLKRSYADLGAATLGDTPANVNLLDHGRWARFAQLIHQSDERLRIVANHWPQDMTPYGWIMTQETRGADWVDIWSPPAQYFSWEDLPQSKLAGREIWFTADRPPYSGSTSVYASSSDQRILSWQAARTGSKVVQLGPINPWPSDSTIPNSMEASPHNPKALLYSGRPFGLQEPILSVRLKVLRQSLQDAAYRKLLQDRGLEHITEMLVQSLSPYLGIQAYRTHFADGRAPGWPSNPRSYQLARQIMIDALLANPHDRQAQTDPQSIRRSTTWRRFLLSTRQARLIHDGTRIRLRSGQDDKPVNIELSISLENQTRVPMVGTLEVQDLPESWTPLSPSRIIHIKPGQSRRVILEYHSTHTLIQPSGHQKITVRFRHVDDQDHPADDLVPPLEMVVSSITAPPFSTPLTIDGDLSDWPLGLGNVASEFRTIAPPSAIYKSAGPSHQRTLVFVLRDENALYIAINAELDGPLPQSSSRSNQLRYEDMIPLPDEMVELLIDPLNAGTRSPQDLYHIAIKPSGAYLVEKGIRTFPPCCQRSTWPVDLQVATKIQNDRWTAELRIPWDAFGGVPHTHTIWGFNVTRFESAARIFSTWSAATGNAYDPLSLGNLNLP